MKRNLALALSATLLTSGVSAETVKPYPLTGIWMWASSKKGTDGPTPEKITEACRQSPIVIHEDGMVVTHELPAGAEPGEPVEIGWLGQCVILKDGVEECIALDFDTGEKVPGGVWLSSFTFKNEDQFSYCPLDPVTKKRGDHCITQYRCDPTLFTPDPKTGRAVVDIPDRPFFEDK